MQQKSETAIRALDFMIQTGRMKYHCDPWYREPGSVNYESVAKMNGQINYKNEIFVINHSPGYSGSGGMSEGSPPSVDIFRVSVTKQCSPQDESEVTSYASSEIEYPER